MVNILQISLRFLSGVPVNEIFFSDSLLIKNLSIRAQGEILNKTINFHLVQKYPLNIDYQKKFLKYILDKLQESECEVHEDIYESYIKLIGKKQLESNYFKHYFIKDSGRYITLQENINLIANGTTGLRTWQASLALSEWALRNKQYFSGKNILELGSGIGLTGLIAVSECCPQSVYFTDGHPLVLKTLCENIKLNIELWHLDSCSEKDKQLSDSPSLLKTKLITGIDLNVLDISWENVDKQLCESFKQIDTVFAADIIYDSELFLPLINALKCFVKYCAVKDIIFACTVRNLETLSEFLSLIGQSFVITEKNCPEPTNFFWSDSEIRIFTFRIK